MFCVRDFFAVGSRVIVAFGTVFATCLMLRHRRKRQNKQLPAHETSKSSDIHIAEAQECKTASVFSPSGLQMLSELQLLTAAPLDSPSLGRLAACSSHWRAAADASQMWKHQVDALDHLVLRELNLGIPKSKEDPHAKGRLLVPGCRVRLEGLTTADYNGLMGTVLPESEGTERVPVQIDGPQKKRVLLKPSNMILLGACDGAYTNVNHKVLLRLALGAVQANEAFYESFRGGYRGRMRQLWLDEDTLKPNVMEQLLGGSLQPLAGDGIDATTYLPMKQHGSIVGTRCVHPQQGLLLGYASICHSWDRILASPYRPREIRPVNCWWELDPHGRARVTLMESLDHGVNICATNAFVYFENTWRMVTHVAH